MSSEWPLVTLGDYCIKIGSGATPKGGKSSYLDSGPVRLIRSQNVYNDGFRQEGLAHISEEQARRLDGVAVLPGDVLINITGDSVARVCLAPAHILPARVNQHVAIIRPNPEDFDFRFLRYVLASPSFQHHLLSLAAVGATRNALTKGMLEKLVVPKPSLREQQAIAEPLWALEQRIELLQSTSATLESVAQALFKSWFVDFDPVRAKAEGREPQGMDADTAVLFPNEFEDSELGPIPKGWGTLSIGDIAQNIRSQARPEALDSSMQYIGLEHMPRKSIALREAGTTEGLASGKFLYARNDILFGKLRPYFHKVGVASQSGVCSTDILVVRPTEPEWFGLLTMHLSSDAVIAYATQLSNGARMPRTSWQDLARYRIVVPPKSLIEKFDGLVRTIVGRIHLNVDASKTLLSLRDSLLPCLISGKLRVPEVEQALAEAVA